MSKIKSFLTKTSLAVVGLSSSTVVLAQEAALDPAISGMFSDFTAWVTELFTTYGWPLIALIAGTFALMKIVKRIIRSA